jgi:polar amino acid transport system substrate-binding protein
MRPTHSSRTAWLLALLALVLAACGGGDDTADTTGTTDGASDTTAPAGDDLLSQLQSSGAVRIGIANEVPYGYEDEDGNPTGEAPEVAKAVLANLGIENVEAVVVEFGTLIPGLQAGQFDMIAAGMFITPERAQQIIFSDPDYCVSNAFAVADGNPLGISDFQSIIDSGATLAVLSGAVDEGYAEDSGVPDSQIERFADVNAQYDALAAGRVDAVSGTALTVNTQADARSGIEATPGFFPVIDGVEQVGCGGFGFLDQGFRDAFNAELKRLQADGTVERIVTSFGFAVEDVEKAASLTAEELANPGSGDAAAPEGLLADLLDAGAVRIGIANEVPYGYEDEDGNPTGEAPEVAKAVLANLGIENVEAVVVEFGTLIPGLQAGQFDMIAAGMFITPERAQQIIFSDPDYCVSNAFAVADGNPLGISDFQSIIDSGATLAVLSGAVDEGYAEDSGVPDSQIERFADVNAQYDALAAGRVDAVSGTALTVNTQADARSGIEATPGFFPVIDGVEQVGCGGFGFLDQGFRDAFNAELKRLQADGTVERIVTSFGFAVEDVEKAAALTAEELANP